MAYDIVKQGVDYRMVLLLLLKWPIYAFKLLRRGRFATIAELRRDAYRLNKASSTGRLTRSDSENFIKGMRTSLGSGKIALTWAFFLALVLFAENIIPELHATIATLLFAASMMAIIVGLSSIVRESSSAVQPEKAPSMFSSVLAGAFFVASTLPFSLPWIIAFFFPRQCLLFFTAWAVFGAIINEVSVLVSHARIMKGLSNPEVGKYKKDDDLHRPDDDNIETRVRPKLARKRTRKTTEQRIATISNFTVDDRHDLEEYIISEEGLKWWAAFLAMQVTVSGIAVFLRLFVDTYFTNPAIIASALLISMCLLCESFWMSYAAGGRWLHFRQQWRFFQPFVGGQQFASMQVVAWLLFFGFLVVSLADLRLYVHDAFKIFSPDLPDTGMEIIDTILSVFERVTHILGLHYLPRGSVALCGAFAELTMLVSLPLYQGPEDTSYFFEGDTPKETVLDEILNEVVSDEQDRQQKPVETKEVPLPSAEEEIDPQIKEAVEIMRKKRRLPLKSQFSVPLWELSADALRTAWLSPIVLTLTKPEVVLFLTGFTLTKFLHGTSFFGLFDIYLPYAIFLIELLYLPTYFGNPRRSGRRRWWDLRGTWVYDELSAYWYMNIIRERELNPRERHVFGYHPHGMLPMGASYIHNTTMWMNLFPEITPFTLTATVTHLAPLLRDVTQYNGGIEVTQESFSSALVHLKNVLLVPGGQHEMLLISDDPNECYLSSKHKGFVRLALLTAAEHPEEVINLVPIYAFGEAEMLYNAFPASLDLQRWLVSKLRLNPAFLPVGRFNLAGVPRRVPITFVVGAPIRVPVVDGVPTDAQVDLLAQRYYSATEEMFDKHKNLCDGYENGRVTFVPPIEKITKAEFEEKWKSIEGDSKGPLAELKRKRDPPPYVELIFSFILSNLCLWVPYLFFANEY